MTPQDTQEHRPDLRLPVHGRRTRTVVALLGLLLSLGVPVVVLGAPVLTVDGHAVGSLADPAGLGITAALPSEPVPTDPLPSDALPGAAPSGMPVGVPGDPAGAGAPGIATPPNLPEGPLGIPGNVLDAYQFAQRTVAATQPGCHLSWSVLAGIGRVESDHASGGRLDAFGNTLGPILGPRLDGSPGVAAIPDTDHGQWDGDTVWDRAVGPMQFIPSTWRRWGVDGNGDGVADPNNIYDATVTAGRYLCAGGADLADPTQLQAAVLRYNQSATYVSIVLLWAQAYLTGVMPTPSAPGPVPPGTTGNGGRSIVTAPAPPAPAALAALAQSASLATPPATTPSPTPPPSVIPTTPPVATPPATVPSAPPAPPATTTTAPVTPNPTTTPNPPPPATTTPVTTIPATTSSPLSPPPLSTAPPPLG